MTHANASLTPEGRRRLAHLVVEEGRLLRAVQKHRRTVVGHGHHALPLNCEV